MRLLHRRSLGSDFLGYFYICKVFPFSLIGVGTQMCQMFPLLPLGLESQNAANTSGASVSLGVIEFHQLAGPYVECKKWLFPLVLMA